MRYLKIISLSLYAAGLLAMTGCAAENPEEPAGVQGSGKQCWVTFEILRPTEENSTRAEGSGDTSYLKSADESAISSLVAMLVDTDDSKVCGIASGTSDVKIVTSEATHKVTINLGPASAFQTEHKYRLYVFANLPEGSVSLDAVYTKTIEEVGEMIATKLSSLTPDEVASGTGVPMTTLTEDAGKLAVNLPANKTYTMEKPYVAVLDPQGNGTGLLTLTPMFARLDFASNIENNTYPVECGTDGCTETEVKVRFKKARLFNASDKAYLFPQAGTGDYTFASPAGVSFANGPEVVVKGGPAFYAPEFIPNAAGGKLAYKATTWMQLEGVLVADADCSGMAADVKTAISQASTKKGGSPKLYYFDDGKLQTRLTTVNHAGQANWYELAYDATLDGYKVSYRHAVRHNAGEGKNMTDGKVEPMEYGILRNYLYKIVVNSVNGLPHPSQSGNPDDDQVESTGEDISIRIVPPAKWSYHRGGTIVEFN